MFHNNGLIPNGLNPEDKTPNGVPDPMDGLMSDWSWRDARADPGYVYTPAQIAFYVDWKAAFPSKTAPAMRQWSFPAYVGPAQRPPRIGG